MRPLFYVLSLEKNLTCPLPLHTLLVTTAAAAVDFAVLGMPGKVFHPPQTL